MGHGTLRGEAGNSSLAGRRVRVGRDRHGAGPGSRAAHPFDGGAVPVPQWVPQSRTQPFPLPGPSPQPLLGVKRCGAEGS